MTMRVTQETFFRMTLNSVLQQKDELYKLNQQVASGKCINQPSDDPVGSITSQYSHRMLDEIDQYDTNLKHGQDWLQTAQSTMQNMSDLLAQVKVKAEQMSTSTYTSEQRAAVAIDASNLFQQLVSLGNTQVNGQYIFSGDRTDLPAVTEQLQVQNPATPGGSNASPGSLFGTGTYTGRMSRVISLTVGAGFSGTPSAVNPMDLDYSYVDDDGETQTGTVTLTGTGSANAVTIADGVQIYAEDIKRWDPITSLPVDAYTDGDTFSLTVGRQQGNSNSLNVNLSRDNRMQYNYNLEDLLGAEGNTGGEFQNILDLIKNWEYQLSNDSTLGEGQSTSQALLPELEAAQSNLLKYIADAGARLNRLDVRGTLLDDDNLRNTDRLGQVEDTPVDQTVIKLSTLETMYQATLQATNLISSRSLADYL